MFCAVQDIGFGCTCVVILNQDLFNGILDVLDGRNLIFREMLDDAFGQSIETAFREGLVNGFEIGLPDRVGNFFCVKRYDVACALFDVLHDYTISFL